MGPATFLNPGADAKAHPIDEPGGSEFWRPHANASQIGSARLKRSFSITIICLTIFYLLRLGPAPLSPISEDDSPTYLVGAVSLAQGHGYRLISDFTAPPARKFPIGYSLLLSGFIRLLGFNRTSVTAIRVASVLFIIAWIALQPRLLRFYMPQKMSYVAPLLIGITPYVFQLSGQIMSEPLFCLLMLVTVLMGEWVLRHDDKPAKILWLCAALVGALASMCTLTRTIGCPLIIAIPLCLGLNRRWSLAVISLSASLLTMAPWIAWSMANSGGTFATYAAEGARLGFHPLEQLITMSTQSVTEVMVPVLAGATVIRHVPRAPLLMLQFVIGLPTTALVVVGLIRLIKTGSLIGIVTTLYLGIVLCWWWNPGRFLMPIYPFLAIASYIGWSRFKTAFSNAGVSLRVGPLIATLLVVVLGTCLYADLRRLSGVWFEHSWGGRLGARQWAQLSAVETAVERLTPGDSVLMTNWPDLMYLLTHRSTVAQPVRSEDIVAALASVPASRPLYVVGTERGDWMSPGSPEYGLRGIAQLTARYPNLLRCLWQEDHFSGAVYDVDRSALSKTR